VKDGVIVILGATGDLATTKLFPALFSLFTQKKIINTWIVGAALQEMSNDELMRRARPHCGKHDDSVWENFCQLVRYQRVDFRVMHDFVALERNISKLEHEHNLSGERLIYCAMPSDFFCPVTKAIIASGLVQKTVMGHVQQSVIYEKPFGRDSESAHEINDCLRRSLDESQIYRIDHYLTKEIVSTLAMIRFSNIVFEPLWNKDFIDSVEIILSEHAGVDGRGDYYDRYGALRDVVQNHALELLALVAMEAPENLVGDAVRECRAHVLERVHVVDALLGQYEGYEHEPGVIRASTTETYAALVLEIKNDRWSGVPFCIKAGKGLGYKETKIVVRFKTVDCLLTKGCPLESNHLTVSIDPQAAFTLTLNAKKQGSLDELEPIAMEYCQSCMVNQRQANAYETVFQEVMAGDTAVSVRFDEIESAWRVIDAVYEKHVPLYRYARGSDGPVECHTLLHKYRKGRV
jgi:glucose-6-phosphate 1-dehydrogenase